MGKGDRKTRRGKLFLGSHGKLNPRKKVKVAYEPPKTPPKRKK